MDFLADICIFHFLCFPRYDCGFFMLKYIECWNGRRMAPINPSDMHALRKIFLKKWMDYVENRIDWEELLFPVRKC
jgi:hypothetical protein